MPPKGYKAITVPEELYLKIEKFIIEYNYRKGMKAIRSMTHFVEIALEEYIKNNSKEV